MFGSSIRRRDYHPQIGFHHPSVSICRNRRIHLKALNFSEVEQQGGANGSHFDTGPGDPNVYANPRSKDVEEHGAGINNAGMSISIGRQNKVMILVSAKGRRTLLRGRPEYFVLSIYVSLKRDIDATPISPAI